MYFLFNLLLLPLIPFIWLYTWHRCYVRKKNPKMFSGYWGKVTPEMRAFGQHSGPKVWIHAVSVGEAMAARPIARALKHAIPDVKIAISNTTEHAPDISKVALKAGEVDFIFFFPLDIPFIVKRILNALRPNAVCFVETELWPNLLHISKQRRIATFLVNGRVSDNLLETSKKVKPFWKWMTNNFTGLLMRNALDAERIKQFGVRGDKVKVMGDVKLDTPAMPSAQARDLWREKLQIAPNDKLFILGSVHKIEDELVLKTLSTLPTTWRVAIAPRHIEAMDRVAELIEANGFQVARRSKNEPVREKTVFLLDSVGELAEFYAAADVAFVGGSLIQRGGHNMLEPIQHAVPVVFGPSVDNFRGAAELVLTNELGTQIQEASELAAAVQKWVDQDRAAYSERVNRTLAPHRGAAKRIAEEVRKASASKS